MTVSTKRADRKPREVRRPYAPQKYMTSQEEKHRKSQYRVSVRRADTDWDHFYETMDNLIRACKDPEYRDRLIRLSRKG